MAWNSISHNAAFPQWGIKQEEVPDSQSVSYMLIIQTHIMNMDELMTSQSA